MTSKTETISHIGCDQQKSSQIACNACFPVALFVSIVKQVRSISIQTHVNNLLFDVFSYSEKLDNGKIMSAYLNINCYRNLE